MPDIKTLLPTVFAPRSMVGCSLAKSSLRVGAQQVSATGKLSTAFERSVGFSCITIRHAWKFSVAS